MNTLRLKGKAKHVFNFLKIISLPEFKVTKTYWEYEFKGRMN